jgi:hypothetical protein
MSRQALATDLPKLIYFAERRAHMDAAAFRARWREHARLGMSMPRWRNVRRYLHCDSVDTPDSLLPVAPCDGVAIICYRDEARRLRHIGDRSAVPLMKADEAETFARPVREVALLADEFIFEPGGAATSKLFLRFWRQADAAPAEFRAWWLQDAGPEMSRRLASAGIDSSYVQNHARLPNDGAPTPALCDSVDEFACDDRAALENLLLSAFRDIDGFASHVDRYSAIWTMQTVLHDAP